MIDEDVLRELLTEAADAAPAPGRAPELLVDSLHRAAPVPAGPRRRPPRRALLAAAAALALVVTISVLRPSPSERAALDSSSSGGVSATTIAPVAGGGSSTAGGTASGTDGDTGTGAQPGLPPPAVAAKIVKTGALDLEVGDGAYESTVARITAIAVGLGGYVAESSTSEADDVPSGSIVLRVPAGSFEQLLRDVRTLGDVRSVTTKGADVTAQFTDLEARLSALSATRDRLYEVLRGARNVGDIIAVQDRITGVQTEIEQLQGQQRLLSDQAGFGTLSVTLGGAGAAATSTSDEGIGHAFAVARHRFADSVEGFIAWSGSAALAVIVGSLLALAAWLVWFRGRRRLL